MPGSILSNQHDGPHRLTAVTWANDHIKFDVAKFCEPLSLDDGFDLKINAVGSLNFSCLLAPAMCFGLPQS